jgi:multisubunit Na+/H+ antiporter MnhB subunit
METNNYKNLFVGTLAAALTLLLTGYLYYNVMNHMPSPSWGYTILYTLVVSFALSYLCMKSKITKKSRFVGGLILGLILSVLILAASRLLYFYSNETIICCQGDVCWILGLQILAATAVASASIGDKGSGGDDRP